MGDQSVVSLNAGTLRLLTGDCRAALGAYSIAWPLFHLLKDLRGELLCALNSSVCSLYLEDCGEAAATARTALGLARTMGNRSLEAHALANLGAAERDAGDNTGALAHMREGIRIRRTLNEGADLAADLCDLGLECLRDSDVQGIQQVIDDLALVTQHDIDQMLFPQYFKWVASALFSATQRDDEARGALIVANEEFERRASAIPDKSVREMYRSLPFNVEIAQAFEALQLA